MRTTSEAPVAEPHAVQRAAQAAADGGDARVDAVPAASGAAVEIRGLAHAFGALRVIERLDLAVRAGEVLGIVGPLGLRQVDAARAGQRPARPPRPGRSRSREPPRPPGASPAARTCPSATCCCRGCRRSTTRRWRCGTAAPRAPRPAGPPTRCSSASGWRASSARAPPSSPAACGSGSPSCARCSPASPCCCSTSPSLRWTRSPARRCRSGWRRRWPPSHAPRSWSPTTSRRRSTCPTA